MPPAHTTLAPAAPTPSSPGTRWDVFCRVIDNHGDLGVCARLTRQLAALGLQVRLFVDDASALAWMAPQGLPGVQLLPWPEAFDVAGDVGDVVIEAFGCDLPAGVVQAMAARERPPVWINLEYLSAEPYVERSHGLPSPQRLGPVKWFFYPGFTPRTGGLLREPGWAQAATAVDRQSVWQPLGLQPLPGERVVSLFCYDNPALPALMHELARAPTLLLLTPGFAQRQVQAVLAAQPAPPALRVAALPWLSQDGYDRLLARCDLNLVRGEDSLVRAIWAGAPFVWQAYPQDDGAHHRKVDAMLDQAHLPPEAAALWRAWNGTAGAAWAALPPGEPWRQATHDWRSRLLLQSDLATQLLAFADLKAAPAA